MYFNKSKCGDTCILYTCLPEYTILKNYALMHGCLYAVFTFPNDIREERGGPLTTLPC